MNCNIIKDLREDLIKKSCTKTQLITQRFFKEPINAYGIKSKLVKEIANNHFKKLNNPDKKTIFLYCDDLWQSGYLEESFIACDWTYRMRKSFDIEDFYLFEEWVHLYIDNWASCDTFCNHTLGYMLEKHPHLIQKLVEWTGSHNRWVKRAAAVSLIVPARKGTFLEDAFQIADLLMHDKDDMVQKGYGWLLKVASNKHTPEVFEYVMSHKHIMPRTSLRYAIEKMPDNLKKEAMKK